MTRAYRAWPEPARTMGGDVDAAIRAAIDGDSAGFDRSRASLDRQDAEQVRVLLGAMARDLLERTFPDGLDSDDAEQVVAGCLGSSTTCYPRAHRDGFILALTGSLGVSEPDETTGVEETDVRTHGLLLIADLLGGRRDTLPALVESALGETMRAQTMEMP